MTEKIMIALSGGVDSSVTALLLKEQGYHIEALFMKNWDEDDSEKCSAKADLSDAQQIADKLGIKLHTVNFSSEYWDNVFTDFIKQYQQGLTPNPDVWCNQRIKFDVFLAYALDLGADKIATGHYARMIKTNGSYQLKTGLDKTKDQSYFLYLLNQYQLSKSLFPLGDLTKKTVRQLAQKHQLITANKKDSTGICFIGKRNFKQFVSRYIQNQSGDILDKQGNFIKKHDGIHHYTIGQRQGLGIGGGAGFDNAPWFVADKDIKKNQLTVVQGDDPLLYHQHLLMSDSHWINDKKPILPLHCQAKIRYRQSMQDCLLVEKDKQFKITFKEKQRAITPGQSVVLYQNQLCLGGGIITKRIH